MTNAVGGMGISTCTDDQNYIGVKDDDQDLLTAAIAAKSILHLPSLHSLLERLPDSGTASKTSNNWDDSKGKRKGKCNLPIYLFFLTWHLANNI